MTRPFAGAFVLLVALAHRSAPGAETVTIGGVELPAECPLAAGVEDDYKKWSGDPRYGTWMTRPEYSNFIGAAEVEAYGR